MLSVVHNQLHTYRPIYSNGIHRFVVEIALLMTRVVAKQVVDVNDHAPTVQVVFLGADDDEAAWSGRVSRHARPTDTVARVSVADADRLDNVTVQLRNRPANWSPEGSTATDELFPLRNDSTGVEPFLLTSHGDGVYVVTLASSLTELWYRLEVVATDSGALTTSTFLDIFVDDEDHSDALRFSRSIYRATLSTDALPGSCVAEVRVSTDRNHHHDEMITYRRLDDGKLTDVFHVGRRTGRICTRSWLACDSPGIVRLAVLASDWSVLPPRSTAVAVELNIIRALNAVDRQSFETGFYHVHVDEDVPVGHCILTVSIINLLTP